MSRYCTLAYDCCPGQENYSTKEATPDFDLKHWNQMWHRSYHLDEVRYAEDRRVMASIVPRACVRESSLGRSV